MGKHNDLYDFDKMSGYTVHDSLLYCIWDYFPVRLLIAPCPPPKASAIDMIIRREPCSSGRRRQLLFFSSCDSMGGHQEALKGRLIYLTCNKQDMLPIYWWKIPEDTFSGLVDSMPPQVTSVLGAKGDKHNTRQVCLMDGRMDGWIDRYM